MDPEILNVLSQLTTALSSATTLIHKLMSEKLPERKLDCQSIKPVNTSTRRTTNIDEHGNYIDLPPLNTKYRGRLEKYNSSLDPDFFIENLSERDKIERVNFYKNLRQRHNREVKNFGKTTPVNIDTGDSFDSLDKRSEPSLCSGDRNMSALKSSSAASSGFGSVTKRTESGDIGGINGGKFVVNSCRLKREPKTRNEYASMEQPIISQACTTYLELLPSKSKAMETQVAIPNVERSSTAVQTQNLNLKKLSTSVIQIESVVISKDQKKPSIEINETKHVNTVSRAHKDNGLEDWEVESDTGSRRTIQTQDRNKKIQNDPEISCCKCGETIKPLACYSEQFRNQVRAFQRVVEDERQPFHEKDRTMQILANNLIKRMDHHPWYEQEMYREFNGKGRVKTRVERFYKSLCKEFSNSLSDLNDKFPLEKSTLCAICFYDLIWFYCAFAQKSRECIGKTPFFWNIHLENGKKRYIYAEIKRATENKGHFNRETVTIFFNYFQSFCKDMSELHIQYGGYQTEKGIREFNEIFFECGDVVMKNYDDYYNNYMEKC